MDCKVDGCSKPVKRKTTGMCGMHMERVRLFGTTERPAKQSKAGQKYKTFVGYRQAHRRVEQARGKAVEHDCYCGCGRPAQEWALMTDHELYWEVKPETGTIRPYSLNVWAYEPMAIQCHRMHDDNNPPVRVARPNLMKEPTG